jgi:hypothetical protein
LTSKTYPIFLKDDEGERDYTRNILNVSGNLHRGLLHILANHWASGSEGAAESAPKRITADEMLRNIVDEIQGN